ncbi:MAG: GNAT family N-acetyltransferase [Stappiaceae bacterium]
MKTPEIKTERMTLRAPNGADFAIYERFFGDANASKFYGGPMSPLRAWKKLAADLGHWHLRGYGMWALQINETDEMIGACGLVWPEGWPRHELTWWIVPSARRRGYALEASRAAISFAYRTLKWEQVETHMDDNNDPARNLALKLGGTIVDRIEFPDDLKRNIYVLPPIEMAQADTL